ncbi:hypothetical protein AYI70_g7255, partial [Smittium culicis]
PALVGNVLGSQEANSGSQTTNISSNNVAASSTAPNISTSSKPALVGNVLGSQEANSGSQTTNISSNSAAESSQSGSKSADKTSSSLSLVGSVLGIQEVNTNTQNINPVAEPAQPVSNSADKSPTKTQYVRTPEKTSNPPSGNYNDGNFDGENYEDYYDPNIGYVYKKRKSGRVLKF